MAEESDQPIADFINKGMDELIEEQFDKSEDVDDETEPEKSDKKEIKEPDVDDTDETLDDIEDEDEEEDEKDAEKDTEKDKEEQSKPKGKSPIAAFREEFKEQLKKHPEVERNYFLGVEYGKLFESPEQATEIIETKEYIDDVVGKSLKGDPQPLLEALYNAEDNKAGFARFVLSFLPTINEVAPKLAQKILHQPIINLFAQLGQAAEERGDDQLLLAVKYCVREITGKAEIPQGGRIEKFIKDTADVDEEKKALLDTATEDFYRGIQNVTLPALQAEIIENLSDEAKKLSDGMQKLIGKNALEMVLEALEQDEKHMKVMLRLQKAARANRFSVEYKKRIAREVMEAARNVIPDIVQKVEGESLGPQKKAKKPGIRIPNNGTTKTDVTRGSRTTGGSDDFDVNEIDFKQTSIRDALDFDINKVKLKPKRK